MYIIYPTETAKWVYTQDNLINDTWKTIIAPYERFLTETFGTLCDGIFDPPIKKIEDPNHVEFPHDNVFNSIWYTDIAPKNFMFFTDIGMMQMTHTITSFLMHAFMNRVDQLYIKRFGEKFYTNITTLSNLPLDVEFANKVFEELPKYKKNLMVCAISKNFPDFNIRRQKLVVELCNAVGNTLSKVHFFDHPESLRDELIAKSRHVKDSYFNVYEDPFPITLAVNHFRSAANSVKTWYTVQLYKNDKLVVEKKGIFVPYSWMVVITNMLKLIKKTRGGTWTMIMGFANYPNEK